jgi:hypothetical protein
VDRARRRDDPLAPLLDLPGVAAGVQEARDAVDAMLSNRVLRRRSADVSAESALRGAWASTELSGSAVSLAQVRAGSDDPLVQGALRGYAELGQLAEVWRRAPRQALARLHALAAADLLPADALGRPSAGADRLNTLAGVLTTTAVPAVVVAGIVHGEVLSLDAFAPVSGIVARAAVRLALITRGLDPKSLVVVEAGHRDLGDYDAAIDAYRSGTPDGVRSWLRHCARAVAAGARETVAICEALSRG